MMKTGLRRFVVGAGVAGLLAASAMASTPTFTLTLAGIKRPGQDAVIFQNFTSDPFDFTDQCDPNDDQCPALAGPGSECVLTEVLVSGLWRFRCSPIRGIVPLLCVGGPTPGKPCEHNADCAPGTCTASLVGSGDQIAIDVYLSGWDDDLDMGICTDHVTECAMSGTPPCPGRHCEFDHTPCFDPCSPPQLCVPDECMPGPRLGAYQWTPDPDSFVSTTTGDASAAMYVAPISCDVDADCRHGRVSPGQCTCGDATCQPNGTCTRNAAAYINHLRADFLCKDCRFHITDVSLYSLQFFSAFNIGLEDDQKEEYVGTLWLQVPNQAYGTYNLALIDDPNFTMVIDELALDYDSANIEGLQIEVADPCAGFDPTVDCIEPPSVCHWVKCVVVDGVPTCVLEYRDCEEEVGSGYECIVAEGGCVPVGACCVDPCTGECQDLSLVQCVHLDGFWLGHYSTCQGIGGACDTSCIFSGPIDWTSSVPPSGVLDARQPHDVNDQWPLFGIDTIVVNGDYWGGSECFELCETDCEGPPNRVEYVVQNPPGTNTIRLLRPITPGGVTSITFCGPYESTGTFASLPGDTNADGVSNADDITELVECCLNRSCVPAHGEYSCDIDHSGSSTGADVLRVLDLLSGAGEFTQAWDGVQLTTAGCP
ncbi:MAG: hypothetical protein ACYTFA_07990 [Planctomycetota bacterium]|jgi:hypothetical protein